MERDARRDRSQWRGCHTFNDIICDGDQVSEAHRSGGLKMGHRYYYYYELDGSVETYDPSLPTTNACPYLPGQTVNTLEVPLEHPLLRTRSASMNSLRTADFQTMDPKDKFTTPRPAPPVPSPSFSNARVGSSPAIQSLKHKTSARSLSPAPKWTSAARRFFGCKTNYQDNDYGSELEVGSHYAEDINHYYEPRSTTPSGSTRSRDISPESLRRFLSEDLPPSPVVESAPKLSIPDEIVEETDDDDNFATSAVSESAPVTTLSPPPFQRSSSSSSIQDDKNASTVTIVPEILPRDADIPSDLVNIQPTTSNIDLDKPRSHFSFSTVSSNVTSPNSQSTDSRDFSQLSFFEETDDEDEDMVSNGDEFFLIQGTRQSIDKHPRIPFTGYSLPQPAMHSDKHPNTGSIPMTVIGSPALVARNENDVPVGNTNLLSRTGIDGGLDDLVSEMGWIADVIQPRDF
ncbi:hypothetical protein F4779DRAFT_626292 [Xylariaceae sp. FL0662B]|nr:hypothetical protein F4779DRAFT_626292 [Xylariaceae sp. FL0662B]